MSKLQELIKQHCPNGVEYKKLGELISIYTGVQFNKRDMNEQGMYPVINGGINPSGFVDNYNEEASTITVSQGGASAGYVAWQYQPFWAGAHCFVVKIISDKLLNRYLFFFLKNQEFLLQQMQHGAGIPALNRDRIRNLEIPVPPLEVQEEIVKILDRFSEYAAELQAELQARREQYEYYRDKLLSFNKIGGVLWLTMNEIGTFYSGLSGKSKEDFQDGNAKFVTYKNIYSNPQLDMKALEHVKIYDNEKQNLVREGDILFTGSSETAYECGMSSVVAVTVNENLYLNSFCFGLRLNIPEQFNIHYLKHLLRCNEVRKQIKQTASGVTRYNISKKRFANLEIPVPPLEVQEEIVGILDKFETLVNDLSEGLPSEIAAVGEQYEYYRNKLLTFPRA